MNNKRVLNLSFTACCLAYMTMSIIKLSPSVVMPDLQKVFNLSSASVGLISSMYYFPYAFMQLITGPLCHRFGNFNVLCTGLAVSILGILLFAFAQSPVYLFFGRLSQGLGLGPIYISLVFFLQDNYSGSTFVRLTGIAVMVCSIGSAISGAPLKALVNTFGIQNAFIILASLIFAILFVAFIAGRFYSKHHVNKTEYKSVSILAQIKDCFGEILSNPAIRCAFCLWFLYNSIQITYQGLWSAKWFATAYPKYESLAGFSSTFASIGLVVSCAISDFITNKKISRNLYLFRIGVKEFICIAALVLGKNLSTSGGSIAAVVASLVIDFAYGFYTGHICVQISAEVKDHVKAEKVATIMGISNFVSGLFSQVLQWASGKIIDVTMPSYGYRAAFNISFALIALLFGSGVVYSRRLRKIA